MKKLTHWQRHLKIFIKYGSLLKYANLLRAYLFYLKGTSHISTMPSFLKVEISRKCTIKCKYCELIADKDDAYFPLEDFKNVINKFKPYIFEVSLYEIGEPLENIEVIDYIKYAKINRIGTIISTTLSLEKNEEFWEELVLSGLDYMIVAIDGITDETYRKYRTNGNLNWALSNLQKIVQYREKHKAGLIIEWQMLDLPWNKQEQRRAKKMAMNMGCDRFRIIEEMVLQRLGCTKSNTIRKRNCLLPYIILIINAYQHVRPCYKIYHENMVIGNYRQESFNDIWNGDKIKSIRDRHKIKKKIGCMTCKE